MMDRQVSLLLWGASLFKLVIGGPVADPLITPAPRVVFRDQSTDPLHFIGWVDVLDGTTTSWESWTCTNTLTLASGPNWYKCCPTAGACDIYTSCSSHILYGAGVTLDCATEGYSFCTSNLLFPSVGALSAKSALFCGSAGVTGTNIFEVTPGESLSSTAPTTTTSSSSSSSSTTSTTSSTTATNTSPAKKSKSNTGAIVGGVVGGLAVLGIAVIGIVFILLKRRKRKNGGSKGEYVPPPDQQPGNTSYQPYYNAEKTDPSHPGQVPYHPGSPPPQMGPHGYMMPPGQPAPGYPPQGYDPRYSGFVEMPSNSVPQHPSELDSTSAMGPSPSPQPDKGHDGKPRAELGAQG